MFDEDTSLQEQSPLSQAQQSVETADHAVTQAMSHPTYTMIEQAEHALERAENAVGQAANSHNHIAFEETKESLDQAKADLSRIED